MLGGAVMGCITVCLWLLWLINECLWVYCMSAWFSKLSMCFSSVVDLSIRVLMLVGPVGSSVCCWSLRSGEVVLVCRELR